MELRILLSEELKLLHEQSEIEEVYLIDDNGDRVGGVISTEQVGDTVYANLEIDEDAFDRIVKGGMSNQLSIFTNE